MTGWGVSRGRPLWVRSPSPGVSQAPPPHLLLFVSLEDKGKAQTAVSVLPRGPGPPQGLGGKAGREARGHFIVDVALGPSATSAALRSSRAESCLCGRRPWERGFFP